MPSLFLPSVLLNQDENLSFLLLACCVSDTAGVTNNMSVLSHLLHTASTPISPSQTLRCFCFKSVCLEYPMLSLSQEVRCGGIAVGALCQEVSRGLQEEQSSDEEECGSMLFLGAPHQTRSKRSCTTQTWLRVAGLTAPSYLRFSSNISKITVSTEGCS